MLDIHSPKNYTYNNSKIHPQQPCILRNFKVTKKYKGKVFIIFSKNNKIANEQVLTEIQKEIKQLKNIYKIIRSCFYVCGKRQRINQ